MNRPRFNGDVAVYVYVSPVYANKCQIWITDGTLTVFDHSYGRVEVAASALVGDVTEMIGYFRLGVLPARVVDAHLSVIGPLLAVRNRIHQIAANKVDLSDCRHVELERLCFAGAIALGLGGALPDIKPNCHHQQSLLAHAEYILAEATCESDPAVADDMRREMAALLRLLDDPRLSALADRITMQSAVANRVQGQAARPVNRLRSGL